MSGRRKSSVAVATENLIGSGENTLNVGSGVHPRIRRQTRCTFLCRRSSTLSSSTLYFRPFTCANSCAFSLSINSRPISLAIAIVSGWDGPASWIFQPVGLLVPGRTRFSVWESSGVVSERSRKVSVNLKVLCRKGWPQSPTTLRPVSRDVSIKPRLSGTGSLLGRNPRRYHPCQPEQPG